MAAQAMEAIAKRVLHNFHLRPMDQVETRQCLHSKLIAAGSENPESVFPDEVSDEIWRASAGWPGIVDRIALLALAQTDTLPVELTGIEFPTLPVGTWVDRGSSDLNPDEIVPPEPPRLVVTNNGSVMSELSMDKARGLIGRSVHNDISINSQFVSRHHALLVRHGASTFLMDLNSTNGTFVNSKRVSNHVLVHDDVITVGHHHIKFYDVHATANDGVAEIDFTDTEIMKTLNDMRALLAQENISLLPRATEQLPTVQT